MSEGYKCVCFPLQRQKCEPLEFLDYLKKLQLSPMLSRISKVEYNPVLGSLDETGEHFNPIGRMEAVERMLDEDVEIVFNHESESVVFRVGIATHPKFGRFATHSTSGRQEKKVFQEWLCKHEIPMHDLCAAFASSVGSTSFSFESVDYAIRSITGEIDREYFEDGRGDFKSYPTSFAGLPNESTEFFRDQVLRRLSVSQSYVPVKTSIGTVYCLALGKDHNSSEKVELSDGMGRADFIVD